MEQINKQLVFLDTETTGVESKDRLVQVAYKTEEETVNELFKAELLVSIDAMAVCHITNKMLENKESFEGSELQKKMIDLFANKNTILVAHNAKFDIEMLRRGGVEVKDYICTLKIAQYLDTEAVIPKYNMQYLRYYLDLNIEGVAHDALGDVLVLEGLFERLFNKFFEIKDKEIPFAVGDDAIENMIRISNKPILIKRFMFGKHEGRKVEDIAKSERSYLQWWMDKKMKEEIKDEDWIYTLNKYLN